MAKRKTKKQGFTLIELLVVIAIIGLLAGIVANNSIRGSAQARDAKRIQELYQIAHALQLYYSENDKYPDNTDSGDAGCWDSWDAGSVLNEEGDPFISPLVSEGFLNFVPIEKNPTGETDWEKCSYRYQKIDDPCECSGTYAMLYATCGTNNCPTNERPDCCSGTGEGGGEHDAYDIAIFLEER